MSLAIDYQNFGKMTKVTNKIYRASQKETAIQRHSAPTHFREESEVHSAYEQVGYSPNRNTKSWYRDIYEFYQNNEC